MSPLGCKAHTTWLHRAMMNTACSVSFTPHSSDMKLCWILGMRKVAVSQPRFSPAGLINTLTTRKPGLRLLHEQVRSVAVYPWLALALSWPPGSQDMERDVAEGRGQQRCNDEAEPATVPCCQGRQCKRGALERRTFELPCSQMQFQTWLG